MEDGVIRQDADAGTVLELPETIAVAKFFGDPPMNLIQGTIKTDRDGLVFSETGEGTIALRLPAGSFGNGPGITGKPVVLGIRPEALEIAGPNAVKGRTFRALIARIELNSWESDVYLRTGAHQLVCRQRLSDGLGEGGRRAEFAIDPTSLHFFDAVTGYRITAQT